MQNLNQLPKNIIYVSVLVSLVLTPWINVDSMIVPKVILLFWLALYILPKIEIIRVVKERNFYVNSALILSILIIVQLIVVVIVTDSPIEQQVFGRTGRGLGLITNISLIIILIAVIVSFSLSHSKIVLFGIFLSSFISSFYSILQYIGLDLINWATRTNGIIGTLGNPNFQAAFAAMSLPIAFMYLKKGMKSNVVAIIFFILTVFTIYLCQSYQGYIAAMLSLCSVLCLYLWYKNKFYFYVVVSSASLGALSVVAGLFNLGPASGFIYKSSVASRGEMWRTSISTSSDNPIFGVGLDSLGDYSNFYKSSSDALGINEYIDNSHNYFLEYAATGGYPLAIMHILLVVITALAFIKLQSNLRMFDLKVSILFGAWVAFQAQSLISPANITLLVWNYIITGFIIGGAVKVQESDLKKFNATKIRIIPVNALSTILLIIAIFVSYPYFNADRLQLKAARSGDVSLAVQVAQMYPESVMRYQKIGVELLQAGFVEQSVEIARDAVEFNPNSFYGWALLLSSSSIEEKNKAVKELKRLDPHNKIVMELDYFE